jgi:hypothetical protein
MRSAREEPVWAARILPVSGWLVGAIRSSARLHWTCREAQQEAEQWARELEVGPIRWRRLDAMAMIGELGNGAVAVVRGYLLPRGKRPVTDDASLC